jgi:hypothetical protein
MIAKDIIEETLDSIKQITELAGIAPCPCISIYLANYSPENDSAPFGVKLHAAVQRAKEKLDSTSIPADGDLPLERLTEFARERRREKERGSLAVFCTRELIRIFRTQHVVSESVHVGNDFYITPLLSALTTHPQFVILALSQNHVRLLRCSNLEAVEVHLPDSLPRSVAQAGAFDKPDHDLENRSAAGSAPGSRHRIHFGTGKDEEKKEEYIAHFFTIIDQEVNQLYRRERLPLILAAVRRESALYKRVSSYPHLVEGSIQGSPEGISSSQLHRSALGILEEDAAAEEEKLLSQFAEAGQRGLTLTHIPTIRTAALRGQIHLLLLVEPGSALEEAELLNSIALETLRHDGHVATFAHRSLPSREPAAAILRYKASSL